jgi:hypothetical protein
MGDVSRRAVLGAGAGAVGVLAFGAGPARAQAPRAKTVKAAHIAPMPLRAHYARSVGRAFTAVHGGRTVQVKLSYIRNVDHVPASQSQRAFILIFVPTGRRHLSDGIYQLKRKGVPTHTLALTSVGSDGGLQAVVNRSA